MSGVVFRGFLELLDGAVSLLLEVVDIFLGLGDAVFIEFPYNVSHDVDAVKSLLDVYYKCLGGVFIYITGPPATAAYSMTVQFCHPKTRARMME